MFVFQEVFQFSLGLLEFGFQLLELNYGSRGGDIFIFIGIFGAWICYSMVGGCLGIYFNVGLELVILYLKGCFY